MPCVGTPRKVPIMFRGGGDPKQLARYLQLSQVGLEMVVPIGLGYLVDRWFNLGPWGMIVGAVCGLILGLVHLVKLSNQDAAANDPPQRPEAPK